MMKTHLSWLLVCLMMIAVTACRDAEKKTSASENNIDAARNFIRAALDGKFGDARNYMLADSVNINYMDVAERSYQRADKVIKEGYRTSTIKIHEITEPLKDSVTIVIYSNSYRNDPDTLRVIKTNGQWLVDLKYLYEHDADTLLKSPNLNDSLP